MIKIGTRNSELALIQTNLVIEQIKKIDNTIEFEIIKINTTGDSDLNKKADLGNGGLKGMFTKEIDFNLINKKIDIAIHSLKDMASAIPSELEIISVLKGEDSRDCFVSNKYNTLDDLPFYSTIGTSSIRRKLMLEKYRPDLKIIHFRGNLNTRLNKLDNNEVDAIILAISGLKRLNLDSRINQILPTEIMMPAISQGVIGVVGLRNNYVINNILRQINDAETMSIIKTERSFAIAMNADCSTPLGVYTKINGNRISISGMYVNIDNNNVYSAKTDGFIGQEYEIGKKLAYLINNAKPS